MNIALAISTLILVFVLIWFSLELSECRKQLKWVQKIKGINEDNDV
jgi:hypothetical protein